MTIIVTGLWILGDSFVMSRPTNDFVQSTWSWNHLQQVTDDSGAARTLNIIRHGGNMSTPGVWDDLVLPRIYSKSSSAQPSSDVASQNFTFTFDTLRPFLDCQALPQSDIKYNFSLKVVSNDQGSAIERLKTADVSVPITAPQGCTFDSMTTASPLRLNLSVISESFTWR